MARLPIVGGDSGNWGVILNDYLLVSHNQDGTIQPGAVVAAGGVMSVNAVTPNASGNVTLTAASIGALASSGNLSDVASPATALSNLGGATNNATGQAPKTANYTLALADTTPGTNQLDYDASSAGTYTIPAHSSVAFPLGANFAVRQLGSGTITIAGSSGVTVTPGNAGGVATSGQGQLITVTQDPNTQDTWWVD